MKQTRIVVLGGGYGGVEAAKSLHRTLKKRRDIEIVLVDKNPYHTFMTELHEVAGGRVEPGAVAISFRKIFGGKKVTLVTDRITTIDFKARKLVGGSGEYPYDYLVIGVGAEPEFYDIPGIKEHSFTLWSLGEAVAINRHIHDTVTLASKRERSREAGGAPDLRHRGGRFHGHGAGGRAEGLAPGAEQGTWPARVGVPHHRRRGSAEDPPHHAGEAAEEGAPLPGEAGRGVPPGNPDHGGRGREGAAGRQGQHRHADLHLDGGHQGLQVRDQPAPVHRAPAWPPAHERVHAVDRLPRGVRRRRRGLLHRGREDAAADRRDGRPDGRHRGAQHHRGHRGRPEEGFPLELPRQHGVPGGRVGRGARAGASRSRASWPSPRST